MFIIQFIRGFLMALSDSVPGVSGGTLAFIMGFYDDFVNALNTLTKRNSLSDKKPAFMFIVKLLCGWVIGMSLAAVILASIFQTQIYAISSVFIGFIIFALPYIIIEEINLLKGKFQNIIFALIGIAIVVLITYLNTKTGVAPTELAYNQLTIGSIIYLFICGIIGISAMILPGISGSTLLLILGVYIPIISAIKDTVKLNLIYAPALFVFGLGIIAGIVLFIRLLRYLLTHHRSAMIYLIIGLMLGSLYAIVMGPTTLKVPQMHMTISTFHPIYFIIGGIVIFLLDVLKRYIQKKTETLH